MFLHPVWSLLLLIIPILIYWFIIRPRLQAKLTEIYADLDSFWSRLWARIYAFRTFVIATIGVIVTALPDLLVQISSADFSFLPQPWPMWVSISTTLSITLMKAFETKPHEDQ